MAPQKVYRIKEVATLSGISVRTLHHYDGIGLLSPRRGPSDYREYTSEDIDTLHRILVFRQMGMKLSAIQALLDAGPLATRDLLVAQREALAAELIQKKTQLEVVNQAIHNFDNRNQDDSRVETMFSNFDAATFEKESEDRWGRTHAFAEARRRTASYAEADWRALKAEQADIFAGVYALKKAGYGPDSTHAAECVEEHRRFLEKWFYPCPAQMHLGLANLYESDARFSKNIDKAGEGSTAFFVEAIRAKY